METYVSNLITRLPSDEFQVHLFVSRTRARSRRRCAGSGSRSISRPFRTIPAWRSVEMAVELIRQHRIDVIHSHLLNAQTLAGVAGRLTNTPAVSTIHASHLVDAGDQRQPADRH